VTPRRRDPVPGRAPREVERRLELPARGAQEGAAERLDAALGRQRGVEVPLAPQRHLHGRAHRPASPGPSSTGSPAQAAHPSPVITRLLPEGTSASVTRLPASRLSSV
jgi:hypothetical protein